jgi:tellurite resistance-related uncharacterized protein
LGPLSSVIPIVVRSTQPDVAIEGIRANVVTKSLFPASTYPNKLFRSIMTKGTFWTTLTGLVGHLTFNILQEGLGTRVSGVVSNLNTPDVDTQTHRSHLLSKLG